MKSDWRWDQRDLTELLTLESAGRQNWRSCVCDTNANGRVYGGQLLGQTLWAAAQTVDGRSPSMLQITFLQGARPQEAIEYSVEPLQDGRRLSTRHVYGVQGTGLVLSANASFQVAQADPGNPQRLQHPVPTPESLPTLAELAERYPHDSEAVQLRFNARPVLDIRPVHPEGYFEHAAEQREISYWVRLNQALPSEGCLHHAALAYLSDSWLNASLAPRKGMLELWQHYYVSNLNHTLWFHSLAINVNEWLLFVNDALHSLSGRGLAMTHIYQRDGRLVASMAQDLLISPRDA
ncbi:acyl-CoA thioesterase [Pseudomonas typographi]|uniref:Acyl-CoA thioesterase II n=1 Tax=Pseudomonas typographi TaxID=2715964 RepID=A0ABR7YWF2_9PSED|nr:acyl-CoA thioesterase domain-containing protein [Pseudomonas typographi]MBD1585559.1 acyl-CoA thioesterase II [Pseudomonas typographi]MBD1597526.1 acyl-CoA thioesterase II [Pseudomonas typographi]